MGSQAEIRRQVERRLVALDLATRFDSQMSRGRVMAALLQAGYTPDPGESDAALFRRFLAGTAHHRAAPRQIVKTKPLVVRPHLRQAEIDAQPTPVSMGGVGNGVEGRNGYGRGQ